MYETEHKNQMINNTRCSVFVSVCQLIQVIICLPMDSAYQFHLYYNQVISVYVLEEENSDVVYLDIWIWTFYFYFYSTKRRD